MEHHVAPAHGRPVAHGRGRPVALGRPVARGLGRPFVLVVLIAQLVAACSASGSPSPSVASGEATSAPTSSSPGPVPTPAPSHAASPGSTAPPEPTDDLGGFICDFPYAVDGDAPRAQLTDVRVGAHDGYDRIVFEFAQGIPALDVMVGVPPFSHDPSGLPLDVAGDGHLVFLLRGGTAITPDGQITYEGPTDFRPDFIPDHPPLVELVQAGDFEAQSEWIAGLTKPVGMTEPGCIRVFALADPDRLVIDLAAP